MIRTYRLTAPLAIVIGIAIALIGVIGLASVSMAASSTSAMRSANMVGAASASISSATIVECKTCELDSQFDKDCVDAPSHLLGSSQCVETEDGDCMLVGSTCFGSASLVVVDLAGTVRELAEATPLQRPELDADRTFYLGCHGAVMSRMYSSNGLRDVEIEGASIVL